MAEGGEGDEGGRREEEGGVDLLTEKEGGGGRREREGVDILVHGTMAASLKRGMLWVEDPNPAAHRHRR
jgi:hypothetical protein